MRINVQTVHLTRWDWQSQGSCNSMDPDYFFHPEGERGGPRRRRIERAKQICHTCPVVEECRNYALNNNEPYGVWGALSEEERYNMSARRRRQPV
ncbi:WhiB family transcriptional regulator [Trueperella sp. LYQ143]|uniref:WhiB family transcriptional regulator n=1 Tax=unclassified Trueperella TaxID=2630174 RepID=UPI0039834FB2